MTRRSVVVGTAGHIDHGKSALVRALTGTDPDRLKEEQARGITIDLGFAHTDVDGVTLSFVDVPGHERFVKNMLAGAGGIDLVILVIAADESVMPQTREHFDICRLLEVPAGLIALTKIDSADADLQALAALEARELTAGSFLDAAPIVGVSSRTGEGLDALRAALVAAAGRLPMRRTARATRMPIDRVFSARGFGTVVTGTLTEGRIAVGDELVLLPGARPATARGLHVHGEPRSSASAGERAAVNLGGVELAEVTRGDTLAAAGSLGTTVRVDARVEMRPGAPPLRHGTRVRFHQGTTELLGRVSVAGGDDRAAAPIEIAGGGRGYVRVRLESPAVLTRGDRFILRSYSPSITIGGGVVLDPEPPRTGVRTDAGVRRFVALDPDPADDGRVVSTLVAERGAAGLAQATLVSRVGLTEGAARALVAQLVDQGRVVCVGDALVAPVVLEALEATLVAAIRVHHSEHPLADGLPRGEARERLFARATPALFEQVLARLTADGRIVARERLALAGHQISLSADETVGCEALDEVFRVAALAPPELAAAATTAKVDPVLAERLSALLVRRHRLVRLAGMLFHVEALERMKGEVRASKAGGESTVDIGTFKDRYGVSRKYAIPLLEYLDRERVTRRTPAGRLIL
ncbi:MAG: selenocysteine-specific translation elongation factor [Vicinamibacterales bacterium]